MILREGPAGQSPSVFLFLFPLEEEIELFQFGDSLWGLIILKLGDLTPQHISIVVFKHGSDHCIT